GARRALSRGDGAARLRHLHHPAASNSTGCHRRARRVLDQSTGQAAGPPMKKLIPMAAVALLSSCTSNRNYAHAVVALVDVSGTYVDQKADVINLIKRAILPKLNPGDSLFVIRIDDESYRKTNLEGAMTLDVRPSKANAQKLAFAAKLDEFATKRERVKYTDIKGAMMLGSEYLKETGAGS